MLKGKNILLGICGGIAAYKIPNLIRTLVKSGASVQTVLTENGANFVGKSALSTLTGNEVITGMFDDSKVYTKHISLSDSADILLVAPATANIIGKFANGIADDFLSTLYLSLKIPVIIAPSMNDLMFSHPATQKNIKTLKQYGVTIIEPEIGELACGSTGKGRLPKESIILFNINKALVKQDFRGKKVIVTCGGTEEAIDPVRIITNKSSGKMGLAIAKDLAQRGASVTIIHGNVSESLPEYIECVKVSSSKEMLLQIEKKFSKSNILVMAAAVSDYKPSAISAEKIKRDGKTVDLKLHSTEDILKILSKKKKRNQRLVGFALETKDLLKNGRKKLKEKGCDLIVANGASVLGSNTTEIMLIKHSGEEKLAKMKKSEAAKIINNSILLL